MQNLQDGAQFVASHFSATPPDTASDAPYQPLDEPLEGTIAGQPDLFTSHGVGLDSLGQRTGAGQPASQISPDLINPAAINFGTGYQLQKAGTPEQAINMPKQGAILDTWKALDRYGVVHLGVGPAIPLVLVAAVAGVWLWTRQKPVGAPA